MEAIDIALAFLRTVVGVTLILHGVNHWIGDGKIAGTARWFESLGLRHGTMQAWMSVLTEVGAGALLALGVLTPVACAAIISVMLVAGVLAHRTNGFFVFKDGYEYVLVLGVVAVTLAMVGPGRVSLDALLGWELAGWTGGLIAVGLGTLGTAVLLSIYWRPERNGDLVDAA